LVEGGAAHTRLHHLAVSDNTDFGIIVVESTDSVIEKTSMSDKGISGLILAVSRGALVARNTVTGSHGFAIFLATTNDSRIQHNKLDGNDHGIAVFEGSSRNIVRSNAVSHSGGSAIDVGGEGAAGNRVEHNRLRANGDGIVVGDAPNTLIRRNLVTGTGFSAFPTRAASASSWMGPIAPGWIATSSPGGGARPSSWPNWTYRRLLRTTSSPATM
jgi:parallel beta-helix repeat protein